MNPTGHYAYMFEGKVRKGFIQNNRDPYKEEIKIPPPYPYKRKNIIYFSHSKDPYFLFIISVFVLFQFFYTPRIHWVDRSGTPKDKDEVNRRDGTPEDKDDS
jgi:hypothetical protein